MPARRAMCQRVGARVRARTIVPSATSAVTTSARRGRLTWRPSYLIACGEQAETPWRRRAPPRRGGGSELLLGRGRGGGGLRLGDARVALVPTVGGRLLRGGELLRLGDCGRRGLGGGGGLGA